VQTIEGKSFRLVNLPFLFIGCFAGGIVEVIVSFCLLIGRVLPPHWQKFAKGVARGWQNFSLIVSVLPLWTIVEF